MSIIWQLLKQYRKESFVLFGLVHTAAIMECFGIAMLLPFMQQVLAGNDSDVNKYIEPFLRYFPDQYHVLILGGGILTFFVLKSIFKILQVAYSANFGCKLLRHWSLKIMERYMFSSYAYVLSHKQGVLLNNIIREPINSSKFVETGMAFMAKMFLTLNIYILMLVASWKMTLGISVCALAVLVIINKSTKKFSLNIGKVKLKLHQDLYSLAAENISAVRQVKTFSAESTVVKRFGKILTGLSQAVIRFKIMSSLPEILTELPIIIITVGSVGYLSMVYGDTAVTYLPMIGLFVVAGSRIFKSVSFMVRNRMLLLSLMASLKVVYETIYENNDLETLDDGIEIQNLTGDIRFESVDFSYSGSDPVLCGLNMVVKKGKTTALIGESGSGKSTIADLMIGLYQPEKGRFLINDIDIRDIHIGSLRKMIGFVTQDTFIFNASIKKNILIGKPDATDEEVVEAARKANAYDFIKAQPKGFDTTVGDRGMMLSGGQRQRIAIARAIIRDPEILIFDEATSSLDTESEKMIQKSIDQLGKEKTVFIITHRLSTIANADVVYKMDSGKVKQVHKEVAADDELTGAAV